MPPSFGIAFRRFRIGRYSPDSSSARIRSRKTSTPAAGVGEIAVQRWKEAGLLKPSVLKPLLATVEKRLVIRKLGRLEAPDREALLRGLQTILGE